MLRQLRLIHELPMKDVIYPFIHVTMTPSFIYIMINVLVKLRQLWQTITRQQTQVTDPLADLSSRCALLKLKVYNPQGRIGNCFYDVVAYQIRHLSTTFTSEELRGLSVDNIRHNPHLVNLIKFIYVYKKSATYLDVFLF